MPLWASRCSFAEFPRFDCVGKVVACGVTEAMLPAWKSATINGVPPHIMSMLLAAVTEIMTSLTLVNRQMITDMVSVEMSKISSEKASLKRKLNDRLPKSKERWDKTFSSAAGMDKESLGLTAIVEGLRKGADAEADNEEEGKGDDGNGDGDGDGGDFKPKEGTIASVANMGFERQHVLEGLYVLRNNSVPAAMDYVLSHPPGANPVPEGVNTDAPAKKEEESADGSGSGSGSGGVKAPAPTEISITNDNNNSEVDVLLGLCTTDISSST